jgi:uncharacterized oligopeptide transporter (OPT) family protein
VCVAAIALSAIVCSAAGRTTGETDMTPAGPLGGLGQIAIGAAAPGGVVAPLAAGGVVNGIVMHSSSLLVNWRIGRLVATRPAAQLIAQIAGAAVGSIACVLVFELLRRQYGFGTEAVPAPTALSWKATAEVVQHGVATMPRYAPLAAAIGLGSGIALALAGRHPRLAFLPSPFAFGIAFILPPYIAIAIVVGALIAKAVATRVSSDVMVTLVSGLIAGEAVVGLVIVLVRYLI